MNSVSLEAQKSKIREAVLAKLHHQTPSERKQKSGLILDQASKLTGLQKGRAIMFYVSLLEEVDTTPLLKKALSADCTVTVPFVDQKTKSLLAVPIQNPKTDLAPGSYGIMEPKAHLVRPFDLNQLEVVLVPGIAFDHKGHRLGRGKGYYDRFLKALPKKVKTIGLAYDIQILDHIPVGDLDITVGQVITN